MKKIITKILQSALLMTIAFAGAAFADASSFVSDPFSDGLGTTSASNVYDTTLDTDNLHLSGDIFYVFIAYQNRENYDLTGVKAMLDFPTSGTSSSITISGKLAAVNGVTETDTVTINNLPSNWNMEVTGLKISNDHGTNYSQCVPSSAYTYDISLNPSLISNSWVALTGGASVLDTFLVNSVNGHTGACDQGHVIAKFRVTEVNDPTPTPDPVPSINTQGATSISQNAATLNGQVYAGSATLFAPYFRYSTSNSVNCSSGSNISLGGNIPAGNTTSANIGGLMANTQYYFIFCGYDSNNNMISGDVESFTTLGNGTPGGGSSNQPNAITNNAQDVTNNSAELNGYINMNSFENGIAFFVWGESQSSVNNVSNENQYNDITPSGDNLKKAIVDYDIDNSETYTLDIDNLDNDEDYYFRICVQYHNSGNTLACGGVHEFTTNTNNSGGSNNNNNDSIIETKAPAAVGSTSAKMCGDLVDDGGDSNLKTWIEYRRASSATWSRTNKIDRGEVYYCVTVTGLSSGTAYKYRACSEDGCGSAYNLTTAGNLVSTATKKPLVATEPPTSIRSHSAVLNGFYVSNADSARVWFNYGRTAALGKQTRSYTKNGAHGAFLHNFTNLAANTTYYYQAVAQNSKGTVVGNILSFRTGNTASVVVVEKIEKEEIDLARLGLGLSLIRLEIDDNREQVSQGENVEYEVTWENISTLDLKDIDLKVTLPEEVQITNTSRGIYDSVQNAIFYTINDLDNEEKGNLTIFGTVTKGSLGDALIAEATVAFDNPVNRAQENATDYDVDEFVVLTALGTASVFGLGNISFLGWLVILLGLLIIFLVARWLYLEREELRAQAYAGGYGRPVPMQAPEQHNHYNYVPPVVPQAQPQAPVQPEYQAPVVNNTIPPAAQTSQEPGYKPYRPNR